MFGHVSGKPTQNRGPLRLGHARFGNMCMRRQLTSTARVRSQAAGRVHGRAAAQSEHPQFNKFLRVDFFCVIGWVQHFALNAGVLAVMFYGGLGKERCTTRTATLRTERRAVAPVILVPSPPFPASGASQKSQSNLHFLMFQA